MGQAHTEADATYNPCASLIPALTSIAPSSRNLRQSQQAMRIAASLQRHCRRHWRRRRLLRLYVSLMTNGANHTMTAVSVLSVFHTIITDLWARLHEPTRRASGVALLREAVAPGRSGDWRLRAIDDAVAAGRENVILALVDLHRIGPTYVTNKKGGDQIMDALDLQVKRDHAAAGYKVNVFDCRLISGGIDMRTIQQIMVDAEREFPEGSEYPDIADKMRCVVATSAISHGVDVDRFNSMFFAGLPSDVAEYIQASSRVGRTHVGFVMLIPTPQKQARSVCCRNARYFPPLPRADDCAAGGSALGGQRVEEGYGVGNSSVDDGEGGRGVQSSERRRKGCCATVRHHESFVWACKC